MRTAVSEAIAARKSMLCARSRRDHAGPMETALATGSGP